MDASGEEIHSQYKVILQCKLRGLSVDNGRAEGKMVNGI